MSLGPVLPAYAADEAPEPPVTARRSIGRVDDAIRITTPNYDYYYLCPELRRKRNRLGLALTVLMLVVYYGYVALIAFDKEFLAQPIGAGVTTLGIPIGMGVILFIAVAPPNERVLYVVLGFLVLALILWFAVENRRFEGPPTGDRIAARKAAIAAAEAAVGERR